VVEEQSKNVSVLSMLETVTVSLAPGAPAPVANASIGMAWAIFTLWQKDPGESGRVESKSVLVSPEGELMVKIARDPDFRPLASSSCCGTQGPECGS